jgi:molecular chaperone GrpE (heat shock protein)
MIPTSLRIAKAPLHQHAMKRTLISLALIIAVSAQAQSSNPGAKVDPKNNKVANPVVEKPKAKLMTRDELRTCLNLHEGNAKEAEAIKGEQASYKANADKLKVEKGELEAADAAFTKQAGETKAERDAILKTHADLTAEAPKLEKEVLKARNDAYQARAAAFGPMVDSLNAAKGALDARRKAFGDKVDALDAQYKALEARTETHFDAMDKWKADCSKKDYDEKDEIAIRKEKAAAAAAGK